MTSKESVLYLKVVNIDYIDLHLCYKGKHKYNLIRIFIQLLLDRDDERNKA